MIKERNGRRLGLPGKIFIGFAATALLPLSIALVATVSAYSAQAGFVAEAAVREKARSASLLLAGRAEKLALLMSSAAAENSLLINLELGLDQPVAGYLRSLADKGELAGIRIEENAGEVVAQAGLSAAGAIPGVPGGYGIERVDGAWSMIVASPFSSRALSGPGRIVGYADLAVLARGIAEELDCEVFSLSPGGEATGLDLPAGRESAIPLVPPEFPGAGDEVARATGAGLPLVFAAYRFPPDAASPRAWIGVAYSIASLEGARDAGILVLAAAGLVAVFLSLLGSAFFARRIAAPALSLAASARVISGGSYGRTTGIELRDEIGDLAREFDSMSLALASQADRREVAEEALRLSEAKFRTIFDGVGEAVFLHDAKNGVIIDVNRSALTMFGCSRDELLGSSVESLSAREEGYDDAAAAALLARAAGGEEVSAEWRSKRKDDGKVFWVEVGLRLAAVGGREVVIVSCRRIEERKAFELAIEQSLREREALIQEIHHRVKNNFQIIDSLLDLQTKACVDEDISLVLREPKARVHAMALVHERLYQSETLSTIDLGAYIEELARDVHNAYAPDASTGIRLSVSVEAVEAKPDLAIPCGLILNELLTNAMKYAFPGGAGKISVDLLRSGGGVRLRVADDGIGFPEGSDPENGTTLGLSLTKILAEQLKGKIDFASVHGVQVVLSFPLPGI